MVGSQQWNTEDSGKNGIEIIERQEDNSLVQMTCSQLVVMRVNAKNIIYLKMRPVFEFYAVVLTLIFISPTVNTSY